jgi:hypothetical protein
MWAGPGDHGLALVTNQSVLLKGDVLHFVFHLVLFRLSVPPLILPFFIHLLSEPSTHEKPNQYVLCCVVLCS